MIGRDDHNEEEPVLKVMDKRKFNPDGSVREGVTIEAEKPKPPAAPVEEPKAETAQTNETTQFDQEDEGQTFGDDGEEIPGAEDPASFVNFLSTLASQAAAALGAIPHPATGQRTLDLETGKYWLEVMAMLKEKTTGNLHPTEQKLFDGILSDLRMQYVQIQRVAEEKLKQQAAQKFSASDILGKK
ncbi:MAG TPA: DUF1844 domain-containing protein [Pyrinomonadaceae bacterium]|nr:DUF1844 domain-containing protein [Pyrinomonadaceae bacterium]